MAELLGHGEKLLERQTLEGVVRGGVKLGRHCCQRRVAESGAEVDVTALDWAVDGGADGGYHDHRAAVASSQLSRSEGSSSNRRSPMMPASTSLPV